jgi:hypothetical protein
MAYVAWGCTDGPCGHVHKDLTGAALCLAERLARCKGTDRRVWRLDDYGRRKELTGAESDAAYRIWASSCR